MNIVGIPESQLREMLERLHHLQAQVNELQERCTELVMENRELKRKLKKAKR
jgi:regulator of replication initiation timing